jgi:hypothetical protein
VRATDDFLAYEAARMHEAGDIELYNFICIVTAPAEKTRSTGLNITDTLGSGHAFRRDSRCRYLLIGTCSEWSIENRDVSSIGTCVVTEKPQQGP